MKTLYLCTPHKLGELNTQLIERIKSVGFEVVCAVTHCPQNIPYKERFKINVRLIQRSDIFVAVLKDYGKDLTAEVGMAYAWKIPSIGINYTALESDAMSYYAIDQIIEPQDLEQVLKKYI